MPTNRLSSLSVVIAVYNAGPWIRHTIDALTAALQRADITEYEVIVVNDGSTDDTGANIAAAATVDPRIIPIEQQNLGRLPARLAGLERARFDSTLILDARIETFPDAFVELNRYLERGVTSTVWNGHVIIRYGWNLFARFWGVVTFVGWRAYLRNPRYVEFGIEEFDWYPKGTTFLLAPTSALLDASRTFQSLVDDPRFASDDTGVLRKLAQTHRIAIAPEFGCWYAYGRSTLRGFARHTYDRGTLFVDSYFRRGTRYFVPLFGFLVVSLAVPVLLALTPMLVLAVGGIAWLAMVVSSLLLGAPWRNVAAFAVVAPLFAIFFGAGIWRGVYHVMRSWLRRRRGA